MPQWVWYIIVVFASTFCLMAWAWWQRSVHRKMTAGHILCEFWPEHGKRYRELLPIEVNGIEVKAPRGHQCPRYFFDKESTYTCDWPETAMWILKPILQVQVPIVSWMENNPEPIHPYSGAQVATAALIDSLRDDDFAAFAMAASKEIAELERQLATALANVISKKGFYIMLGIAIAISLAAAIASYLGYGEISDLKAKWGI